MARTVQRPGAGDDGAGQGDEDGGELEEAGGYTTAYAKLGNAARVESDPLQEARRRPTRPLRTPDTAQPAPHGLQSVMAPWAMPG